MIKDEDIKDFKKEIIAFRDSFIAEGLAPDSPIMRTLISYSMMKYARRLERLPIVLILLTIILAVLTGFNISAILKAY
jgi:hypothetical protein